MFLGGPSHIFHIFFFEPSSDQRELTRREVQEAGPQLDSLRQAVKDLQRKVEKSISELYDGRPGHLIGEINAV